MSVETDLIKAYYRRLAGTGAHSQALEHDGTRVPVFTGNAPTSESSGASAPYVIVGRPRSRGQETIDGVPHPEVRLQLRVHTAFPKGKGNHFLCYEIARSAHDLLEAAPIEVGGKKPYVPQPDLTPIPAYDKGEEEALDLSLDYVFPSL